MNDFEINVTDNSGEILKELQDKIPTVLEAWGLQGERHAKKYCTVDTGRLRNSITHAVSGKGSKTYTYSEQYQKGSGKDGEKRKSLSKKQREATQTTETIPAIPASENAVYIGTNVSYATPVETGHVLPSGKHVAPKPFLKPAVENHADEYKAIAKRYLSK